MFIDIDKDILLSFLEDQNFLIEIKDLTFQLIGPHLHLQGLSNQIQCS